MEIGNVNKLYFWIHSSFSAGSFTFFLALLSAAEGTQEAPMIQATAFFLLFSLISNATISFCMLWLKSNESLSRKIFTLNRMKIVHRLSASSFVIGLLCLMAFYSLCLAVVMILSSILVGIVLSDAIHTVLSEDSKKAKEIWESRSQEEKAQFAEAWNKTDWKGIEKNDNSDG